MASQPGQERVAPGIAERHKLSVYKIRRYRNHTLWHGRLRRLNGNHRDLYPSDLARQRRDPQRLRAPEAALGHLDVEPHFITTSLLSVRNGCAAPPAFRALQRRATR